jgi:hypothetical protein
VDIADDALLYERGLVVNKKLVRKLMRAAGLEGLPARKKGRRNLVGVATQEDLVNRNFTANISEPYLADRREPSTTPVRRPTSRHAVRSE